ncbi:MAG: hypothetical protein ACK40H_00940 [Sphingomonadaceae bacterium]
MALVGAWLAAPGAGAVAPVALDGVARTATEVGTVRTASGLWRLASLGSVGDIAAYRWTRDGADGTRVMLCRPPLTLEGGAVQRAPLDMTRVAVRIGAMDATAAVAPGSCRVLEDRPLVQPNPQWIVAAVRDGRSPAYRRSRSWLKVSPPPIENRGPYRPDRIGTKKEGESEPPHAGRNFVGVTSGQGGEYEASRGFVHNVDARVIELALAGQAIGHWPTVERYTWELLGQPHGAVWSARNYVTADPQKPLPGDRAYEYHTGASRADDDVLTIVRIEGWGRDPSHLENSCWAHWLATEDPVAGLCVQRQLAYALAYHYAFKRRETPGRYGGFTAQSRGIWNTMSALWKARDVARRSLISGAAGLWPASRVEQMAREVIAYYDERMTGSGRPLAALDPETRLRLSTGVLGAGLGTRRDTDAAGKERTLYTHSSFFLVQYGVVPIFLWARDGDPVVRRWAGIAGRHLAARVTLVGGAMGIDQCRAGGGSHFPMAPARTVADGRAVVPAVPYWNSFEDWANWVVTQCFEARRDSFDGAAIHTTTQAEAGLLLFRAAGIPGLDAAIERVAADKRRTSQLKSRALNMAKHWVSPD